MSLQEQLIASVREAVSQNYDASLESVELQPTRKEFEGDITVVIFPMLRYIKGNPAAIGEVIGKHLTEKVTIGTMSSRGFSTWSSAMGITWNFSKPSAQIRILGSKKSSRTAR